MATPVVGKSANTIIASALRSLGVLDPVVVMTAGEAEDGLAALNDMMDLWGADSLMVPASRIDDFPLISTQQQYTMGPGGDFDMDRPPTIDGASIIILSNPSQPLEYPIQIYTTQDWQEKIPIKNSPSNLPLLVYDDGGFPLRNLTFWPDSSDNINVRFYSWHLLTQFPDLTTAFAFKPGYAECIRWNLAVRLAPEFGTSVSPEVAALAMSSMALVKTSNADDVKLRSDIEFPESSSRMRAELFNIP